MMNDILNDKLTERLNPAQKEAVSHTEGPLLIIAGAGSGKTSVLCCRIANIIESGLARPWQILAVTFTNKAAGELRERLSSMNIGEGDAGLYDGQNDSLSWAGTFHSICVKILRRGIEAVGYKKGFTIYDTDDSLRLVKSCMKDLNISEKTTSPKQVFFAISRAKDKLITSKSFEKVDEKGKRDFFRETVAKVYELYQSRMKAANALDFDDIIMKTVELFENNPDILEKWRERFRYIMIDEYQDTNYAQYKLVSLLAGGRKGNLCVVGDEDQSIYRFRGATIENILSFEEEFNARVIKLEQNYRSTAAIIGAANGVIKKNTQRKPKTLFTSIEGGDKVELHILNDEQEEATSIAREIERGKGRGISFGENAVLYRTNAQSRTVELALARAAVPYRIIGGVRFYDRKEIKDIVAYMSIIANPLDSIRFRRIINEPKRGIGEVTQSEIERVSDETGMSPIDVMAEAGMFATLRTKATSLEKIAAMFKEFDEFNQDVNSSEEKSLSDLIDFITEKSGYLKMLQAEGDEGLSRLENIKELKSAAVKFSEDNPEAELQDFLEQVALVSDTDDYESGEDRVAMMTIHAAKGLEFGRVFLIGAEEGLFPSFRSLAEPEDIEEERRLMYVAITRAKRALHIMTAKQRLLYGMTQRNPVSRFVREIPEEFIHINEKRKKGATIPQKKLNKAKQEQSPKDGLCSSEGRILTSGSFPFTDKARQKSRIKPQSPPSCAVKYKNGERIKHKIFGDGTIIDVQEMGNDSLLEISFDGVGTKKIMANFVKIEKI
ncbi:MAG: UvrD-helicase domain-containing protein [Oscillospiraceae bacterium]|nr:UvrD-helicase domain-containing protein [Oscillospiraceae bacterium]